MASAYEIQCSDELKASLARCVPVALATASHATHEPFYPPLSALPPQTKLAADGSLTVMPSIAASINSQSSLRLGRFINGANNVQMAWTATGSQLRVVDTADSVVMGTWNFRQDNLKVEYPILAVVAVRQSQTGRTLLVVSTNDEGRGRVMLIDPTMPQIVLARYYGDHPFLVLTAVSSSCIIAGSTSGALIQLTIEFGAAAPSIAGFPPSSLQVRIAEGIKIPSPATASEKQITSIYTPSSVAGIFLVGYSNGSFDIRSSLTLQAVFSLLGAVATPSPVTAFGVHGASSSQAYSYIWVVRSAAPLQKMDASLVWRDNAATASLYALSYEGMSWHTHDMGVTVQLSARDASEMIFASQSFTIAATATTAARLVTVLAKHNVASLPTSQPELITIEFMAPATLPTATGFAELGERKLGGTPLSRRLDDEPIVSRYSLHGGSKIANQHIYDVTIDVAAITNALSLVKDGKPEEFRQWRARSLSLPVTCLLEGGLYSIIFVGHQQAILDVITKYAPVALSPLGVSATHAECIRSGLIANRLGSAAAATNVAHQLIEVLDMLLTSGLSSCIAHYVSEVFRNTDTDTDQFLLSDHDVVVNWSRRALDSAISAATAPATPRLAAVLDRLHGLSHVLMTLVDTRKNLAPDVEALLARSLMFAKYLELRQWFEERKLSGLVDKLLSGVTIMDAASDSMNESSDDTTSTGTGVSFLAAYEPRRRARARAAALFASDAVNSNDGTTTGGHVGNTGALFIDTMLQLVSCHKQLLYPPPNLDSLLQILTVDDTLTDGSPVNIGEKRAMLDKKLFIIYYFLLDLDFHLTTQASKISGAAATSSIPVTALESHADALGVSFFIPAEFQRVLRGLHMLDNYESRGEDGRVSLAMRACVFFSECASAVRDEWGVQIMTTFFYLDKFTEGLLYVRNVQPILRTANEFALYIRLLLHNNLWQESLIYQRNVCRTDPSLAIRLLPAYVTWFLRHRRMDQLMQLPLNAQEDQLVCHTLRYLPATVTTQAPMPSLSRAPSSTNGSAGYPSLTASSAPPQPAAPRPLLPLEYLVVYHLQRSRVVEATDVYNELKNKVPADKIQIPKQLVTGYSDVMPAIQSDPIFARSQAQTEIAWKDFLSTMNAMEKADDARKMASQRGQQQAQVERQSLLVRQNSVTPFAGRDQGDATPLETPRGAPSISHTGFGESKFGLAAESPFTRRQPSLTPVTTEPGTTAANGAFVSLQRPPSLMRAASTPGTGLGSLLAATVPLTQSGGAIGSSSSLTTRSGSGGASSNGAPPRSPGTATVPAPSSSPLTFVASLGSQATADPSTSVGSSFTYVPSTASTPIIVSAASSASVTSDGSAPSSSSNSAGASKTPLRSFSSSYPQAGFWSASPAGFRPIGAAEAVATGEQTPSGGSGSGSGSSSSNSIMSPIRSAIGSPLRVLPLPDRSIITTVSHTSTTTTTTSSSNAPPTSNITSSSFLFSNTSSSMGSGSSLVLPPRPIRGRLSGALSELDSSSAAPMDTSSSVPDRVMTRSSSGLGSTPLRSMTPPVGSSGSSGAANLRAPPSPSTMSAPDRDRSASPAGGIGMGSARRPRRSASSGRQQTPARIRNVGVSDRALPTVPESVSRRTRSASQAAAQAANDAKRGSGGDDNDMQHEEDDDNNQGGNDDSFIDKRGLFADNNTSSASASARGPSPQVGSAANAPPGWVDFKTRSLGDAHGMEQAADDDDDDEVDSSDDAPSIVAPPRVTRTSRGASAEPAPPSQSLRSSSSSGAARASRSASASRDATGVTTRSRAAQQQ